MAKNTALAAYQAGLRERAGGKKKHSRGRLTIPLAIALGFVPLGARAVALVQGGGVPALANLPASIIPYNFATRKIDFSQLGTGLWPILAGLFIHRFVGGGLGVNRALAAARVPWIRL